MKLGNLFHESKPFLVMTLSSLGSAIFMVLLQSLLSQGINGLVLIVYQNSIATVVLSALAFFLERGKRPPFTFEILCCLLGLLQVILFQLLLTLSLPITGATYQSVAMNNIMIVVFVLANIFRGERLEFWTIHGQAKMWGVAVSAMGTMVMVMVRWRGPSLLLAINKPSQDRSTIGAVMLTIAVLAGASWNLLVGHVSRKYPADLSLSALMSFFGTIQATIVTAFVVSRASWKLKWEGGLVLLAILYGGILMTGIFAYVQTWCIRKKGSVFASAFFPLIIVFSFLLETLILKKTPHLGSIIGGVLVVLGLYMLLWGKNNDNEREQKPCIGSINEPLI